MPLKLYNTLTRKKEEFKPLHKNRVGMYVCGITAYDSCHMGHARAAVCFDVIVRYLRHKGFDVTYVRNFTDVDDKIINRANKENRSCREISEFYIDEYRREMASLGNLNPDIEPKATEHIPEMIKTVQKLIDNGYAYERTGDVFFSVRKFKGYGKLSGKKIDELEVGARININEAKDDPLDFALWKASKPGEPKWSSPWGEGRPGWHIECSSMSSKYLGQPFDIHGGGRDLVFPHHENEIAQAEGAEGCEFVRYWLHNGFININSEKMSKSLGNFTTINELLKKHPPEVLRYFIISNHYRSPIDYTEKAVSDAIAACDRFYETVKRIPGPKKNIKATKADKPVEKEVYETLIKTETAVTEFMDDDFNTAGAIGAIFEAIRSVNKYLDSSPDEAGDFFQWVAQKWAFLRKTWFDIFGMFGHDANEYFESKKSILKGKAGIDETKIMSLIQERANARKDKNFKRSDEIRDKLAQNGIILKDLPDGTTTWQIK